MDPKLWSQQPLILDSGALWLPGSTCRFLHVAPVGGRACVRALACGGGELGGSMCTVPMSTSQWPEFPDSPWLTAQVDGPSGASADLAHV